MYNSKRLVPIQQRRDKHSTQQFPHSHYNHAYCPERPGSIINLTSCLSTSITLPSSPSASSLSPSLLPQCSSSVFVIAFFIIVFLIRIVHNKLILVLLCSRRRVSAPRLGLAAAKKPRRHRRSNGNERQPSEARRHRSFAVRSRNTQRSVYTTQARQGRHRVGRKTKERLYLITTPLFSSTISFHSMAGRTSCASHVLFESVPTGSVLISPCR